MDHPAEFAPVQPWRAAAMVATAVAAIELFILLLIAFVFGAKAFSDRTESATVAAIQREMPSTASPAKQGKSGTPTDSKASRLLPRGKTSVVVLNGNGIAGAAATSADRAHSLHYIITATGNAPRTDFQRSLVMFRPGFKPAALRLAKDMDIKRVTPLDGVTKGDLQGAQLALIVGG
jgi:LytR cell envelope-related transcriptional attenuator